MKQMKELQYKKAIEQEEQEKDEHTNITREHKGSVGKAKAQLEFKLAGNIKGNKNFYHYISNTRMNKENEGSWLKPGTARWYPCSTFLYHVWKVLEIGKKLSKKVENVMERAPVILKT